MSKGNVNSKRKGSNFERELCKMLEDLFGGTFKRVPHSGAYGTIHIDSLTESMKQTLTGDIITPEGFPFSIEAKFYKALPWNKIMQGECKQLDKWIEQSERDACTTNKDALVIFKLSHQGVFLVFDVDSIDKLITELPESFIKYKDKIIISWDMFVGVYNGNLKYED